MGARVGTASGMREQRIYTLQVSNAAVPYGELFVELRLGQQLIVVRAERRIGRQAATDLAREERRANWEARLLPEE